MNIAVFPTYDQYRLCDEHWFGKVPDGWEVRRLKHLARQATDKISSKGSPLRYVGMENVESWTGRIIDGNTEVEGLAAIFSAGDILFGKLRPYLAKVAKPKFSGICSSEFVVLRAGIEINPEFLAYSLRCPDFISHVNSSTYGSKMPRANPSFIVNSLILFPPPPQQRAIAAFLDEKCGKIDEAVRIKEEQIGLLRERRQILIQQAVTRGLDPSVPLKDSGIDWIGQIPAHWDVVRFKYLFSQSRLPVRKHDEVVTSYRDGQVTLRSNRRLDGYTEAVLEGGYQGIRSGQLVLNSMDAFEGAIGVADSDGKCTPEYVICDPQNDRVNQYFFAYLLREMALAKYIQVICNAVRQRAVRIRFNNLAMRFMIVPPASEQAEMVAFIESEKKRISDAILIKEEQITTLKEYKTSLINAAVTGKIKVT